MHPSHRAFILAVCCLSAIFSEELVSPSSTQDINTLLDIAVKNGFPDCRGSTLYDGEIIIASPVNDKVVQQSAGEDHTLSSIERGMPSPTRSSVGHGERDGVNYILVRYRGIARQLADRRWLMGEVELVKSDHDILVDFSKAKVVDQFPQSDRGAPESGKSLAEIEAMCSAVFESAGIDRRIFDQCYREAKANHFNADMLIHPYSLIHAIRSGVDVPVYAFPILDVYHRVFDLHIRFHSDPILKIDFLDEYNQLLTDTRGSQSRNNVLNTDFLDEAAQLLTNAQASQSSNNDMNLVCLALRNGEIALDAPRTSAEEIRTLLIDWFMYQSKLPQPQMQAAVQELKVALGGKSSIANKNDTPNNPDFALKPQTKVAQILAKWQPRRLHDQMASRDTNESESVDDQTESQAFSDSFGYTPGDAQSNVQEEQRNTSFDASDKPATKNKTSYAFSSDDLDELIHLLDERSPSKWVDLSVVRPISDCALRAIAEIFDFDPRHLVGMPVDYPYNETQRSKTAEAIRAWRNHTRGLPLDKAIIEAAVKLPIPQALMLLLRAPSHNRPAMRDRLVTMWLSQPPPSTTTWSMTMVAQVLAAIRPHPQARELAALWDLPKKSPLLEVVWYSALGSSRQLSELLNSQLRNTSGVPTPTADPRLIRKLIVAVAAMPTPDRIALLSNHLRGSLDSPLVQQVLVALMVRSTWIDDLDALLPTAVEMPGHPPKLQLNQPSSMYWVLWAQALDDTRLLPVGIRSAIKESHDGKITIQHLGGGYVDTIKINNPYKDPSSEQPSVNTTVSLASDLRVCDLMAWSLIQQERAFLSDDRGSIDEKAIIDITLGKDKRDELLKHLRKIVRSLAVPHAMAPLAPIPVDKDGAL